jgi:hypothetical protein
MVSPVGTMGTNFPFIAEEDFEAISAELSEDFRAAYPTFPRWQALVDRWLNDPELSQRARPVRVTDDRLVLYLRSLPYINRDVTALIDFAFKVGNGQLI